MMRTFTALAVVAVLSGCDGENPFMVEEVVDTTDVTPEIDPDNPVGTNGIPLALSGNGEGANLTAIAFDPAAGTLSVDMAALDRDDNDTPLEQYTANSNLQTAEMAAAGYQVYSYQDDAADRFFVAIVAESNDGSVQGAIVMDGGQFNRFYGGGFYANSGSYSPGVATSDTGLVSYAGLYAGATNLDADGAELLDATNVPFDRPDQPAQLQGDIFFNVSFDDNTINGEIYNRAWTNIHPALAGVDLPSSVVLLPADITTAGTFFDDAVINRVNDDGVTEEVGVGKYGGSFGGTQAPGVAGVVHLDGDFIEDTENEEEFGVFVLTQCGQPGEAAICNDIPVNP